MSDYGKRADGTAKGRGYFGELNRPDGDVSTEISIGVEMGGKEVEIPSLVPGLSAAEVEHLLSGKEPTRSIVDKAAEHALARIVSGKSLFASDDDAVLSVPVDTNNAEYMQAWGKK